jgi:uncharacterized protein
MRVGTYSGLSSISPLSLCVTRVGIYLTAGRNPFVLVMAAGSILGSFIGGWLLGLVPNAVLLPLLAIILVLSALKVWKHK